MATKADRYEGIDGLKAYPDEVTRRGKNARKKAEKYTWQKKNEKYQAIYEELLKE